MKNFLSDFLDYQDCNKKNKTNQFLRKVLCKFAIFSFIGETISLVSKDNELHCVNEWSETKHIGVVGLSPNYGAKKNIFELDSPRKENGFKKWTDKSSI